MKIRTASGYRWSVLIECILFATGSATALLSFSAAHTALDTSLRCPHPDRTYFVGTRDGGPLQAPEAMLIRWEAQAELFNAVGGFIEVPAFATGVPNPSWIKQAFITEGMLGFLPPRADAGRPLLPSDFRTGPTGILITQHFMIATGLNISSINKEVRLGGNSSYRVLGVLPSTARFPSRDQPDVLIPYSPSPLGRGTITVLEEIRPGLNPSTVARNLSEEMSRNLSGKHAEAILTPIKSALDPAEAQVATYGLVVGILTLILLLATGSFLNMLETTRKRTELSIKLALGATPRALMLEAVVEIFWICTFSFVLGGLLLKASWPWVSQVWTEDWVSIPAASPLTLAWIVALLLVCSVAASAGPIMILTRIEPVAALKEEASSVARPIRRIRMAIVAIQIAVSIGFAFGASRLQMELDVISGRPAGIASGDLWSGTILIQDPQSFWADRNNSAARIRQLRTDLSTGPGITGAALTSELPAAGVHALLVSGLVRRGETGQTSFSASYPVTFVDSVYLQLLGCPLIEGRYFTEQDSLAPSSPVILSEPLARKLFRDVDPVGKEVAFGQGEGEFVEVVGVVAGMRTFGLRRPVTQELFVPLADPTPRGLSFVIRTARTGAISFTMLRKRIADAIPSATLADFKPLKERFDSELDIPRRRLAILGLFSSVAALVAVCGLCAVLLATVRERDREIGIRRALGAGDFAIARAVLGPAIPWVACGLFLGVMMAILAGDPLGPGTGVAQSSLAWSEARALGMVLLLFSASIWLPLQRARNRPINNLLRNL